MFGFGRSATFLLLALLAEIAGTVGGFGSSVFFVPVANVYFDFQSVLGITALFHLASNISKLGLFRGGIDRGLLLLQSRGGGGSGGGCRLAPSLH